jgi:hypothetical protein
MWRLADAGSTHIDFPSRASHTFDPQSSSVAQARGVNVEEQDGMARQTTAKPKRRVIGEGSVLFGVASFVPSLGARDQGISIAGLRCAAIASMGADIITIVLR